MAGRKRRNTERDFFYDISVTDWTASVTFNEYAYHNIFDLKKFAESVSMALKGQVTSTLSKKCKKGLPAKIIIYPGGFWYDPRKIRQDCETIGDMEIIRPRDDPEAEETIYFRLSVPTKSYENMRAYLSYKGSADVTLVGTDLFRRRGEIYYLGFKAKGELI